MVLYRTRIRRSAGVQQPVHLHRPPIGLWPRFVRRSKMFGPERFVPTECEALLLFRPRALVVAIIR